MVWDYNDPDKRWWLAGGTALTVLSCVQTVTAWGWENKFGTCVGLFSLALGLFILCFVGGIIVREVSPEALQESERGIYRQALARLGGNPTANRMQRLRGLFCALGVLDALFVAVHLSSPDPYFGAFPQACPPASIHGCSRVSLENPHQNWNMVPVNLNASKPVVVGLCLDIMAQLRRTAVIRSTPSLVHARVLSEFWGFADDFLLGVSCAPNGSAVVQAHGSLRIGRSDFGVNAARNQVVMQYIQGMAMKRLPAGECVEGS